MAYGTIINFAQVANINSLANNAAKAIGKIDLSAAPVHDLKVQIKITLPSNGVTTDGTIEVRWLETTDEADGYTDQIDPTGSTDISAAIKNSRLLANPLQADTVSQIVNVTIDVFSRVGGGVKFGGIVIFNKCGAALPASGHDAQYMPITY